MILLSGCQAGFTQDMMQQGLRPRTHSDDALSPSEKEGSTSLNFETLVYALGHDEDEVTLHNGHHSKLHPAAEVTSTDAWKQMSVDSLFVCHLHPCFSNSVDSVFVWLTSGSRVAVLLTQMTSR